MLLLEALPSPPPDISPAHGSQSLQTFPSQLLIVSFSKNSTLLNPTPQCSAFISLFQYPTLGTPWTAARQASLSFTISRSLLTLMSIPALSLSSIRVFTSVQ